MSDGIEVRISPASGKRLAEPSSSFSDRFTGAQQRFAAPGLGQRSEIAVEKKIAESQIALVAELKRLRTAMRTAAPGTEARRILEARRNDLYAQQARSMSVAFAADPRWASHEAEVAKALPRRGAAIARGMGRSALSTGIGAGALGVGLASAAWSGQSGLGVALIGADLGMRAGVPLARGAWSLGRSAIGAAFGAGAGEAGGAVAGAAGEAVTAGAVAETAGGVLAALGGWPVIVTAITAALGVGAYEYVKNRGAVNRTLSGAAGDVMGLPKDAVSLALARGYGATEATRQATAFRFARSFQDSGMSMVGASTGGRWSALGLTASESTAMLGSSRELAGSDILSNTKAYRSLRMGVYAGLTNEQNVAATGGFARLGADSEASIKIITEGVLRANERGLQGEVLKAQLDYLRTQSQSTVIQNPTAAVAGVSALASMFQASRIPSLRGAGAIGAIRSIGAAFDSSSLFDESALGKSVTMMGQARLLAASSSARHFTGYSDAEVAKMSPAQRMTIGLRVMDRGFTNTGPDLSLFLKNAIAPTLQTAKTNPLLLDAVEKAWGLARGQATDRMLTNKMLPEAMTGNYTAFDADLAKVKLRAKGMIAPGAAAEARLSHTEARTGEKTMSTYIKSLDLVEKKALDVMNTYLDGGTAPDGTPLPGGAAGARLRNTLKGTGAMSSLPSPAPTPTASRYGASAAGAPISGPGALSGIADAIIWGVRAMIADLDKLVAYAEHPPAPGAPVAYAPTPPLPPSHPAVHASPAHGAVVPPGHTHR